MTGTEKGAIADLALLRQVLDWALTLPQRLPEAPVASSRALHRLARYQATVGRFQHVSLSAFARLSFSMSAFQHVSFCLSNVSFSAFQRLPV